MLLGDSMYVNNLPIVENEVKLTDLKSDVLTVTVLLLHHICFVITLCS